MQHVSTTQEFAHRYPDFRDFLYAVWHHLNLPDPSWIQLDMAHEIETGAKRLIIEAFRGVGKSWITVAYVCYLLATHPTWNILVVSASKASADEFSTFTLRLIREMPDLTWMAPQAGERDSKLAFDVHGSSAAKAPSVKSLGITSQLTGSRADVIIADDIEIPSNSLTPGMRMKLSEQIKEFDSILKPDDHARVIFLGTPQTEDSVYNKLQQRGYACVIWSSRFPNEEEEEEYGARLAKGLKKRITRGIGGNVGSPTDPGRFTDLDLRERSLSYGVAGFALQFQLRTKLSDRERYPLKVRDLMILDCDLTNAPEKPIWSDDRTHQLNIINNLAMDADFFYRPQALVGQWIPYTGIVMSIDPAGRGKDETGYAVVAMLNGYLYVLAAGGIQGGYDEHVLRALSLIAKTYKVNKIIIEANFGDGMYTSLLKPILAHYHDVTCEEVKHNVQKERRMCDSLEPLFQGHRLVVDTKLIETDYTSIQHYPQESGFQYSLIYQLTRLTKEKGALSKDDRVDALSMAVMYWTEMISTDADIELRSVRSQALEEELEQFMDDVHGVAHGTHQLLWTNRMR